MDEVINEVQKRQQRHIKLGVDSPAALGSSVQPFSVT